MVSKTMVDSIYGRRNGVSKYGAIINDQRRMLSSDLVNSDVKFIKRQINVDFQSLARMVPCYASFRIFTNISSCVSTLIMNQSCVSTFIMNKMH